MTTINNDTEVLNDTRAEVERSQKRLDNIYGNIQILSKDKKILESDILALEKHLRYLRETADESEKENAKKKEITVQLDSQIADKQVRMDELQHEINVLSNELEEKKAELENTEAKILEHEERMVSEAESHHASREELNSKKEEIETKLKKLNDFLNEIR